MDLKIKNVMMLDGGRRTIAVEGDRISAVDERVPGEADRLIDGSELIAIPGMINCHTHAAMSIFRGYGDDMPLDRWLSERIWPAEARLTPGDIYWGSKLAILEMIMSGTTTFSDMYFHMGQTAKAASDTGMRAFLSEGYIDLGDPEKREANIKATLEAVRDVEALSNTRITPALGPHAVYTVSREGWDFIRETSVEKDLMVHFHLCETEKEVKGCRELTGMSPAPYLESVGILDRRCTAAHGVYLDERDIRLLADKGVNVVHNPESNMKLGVGSRLRYDELHGAGVNVSLGTDGSASNNGLDLFNSMKFAALLAKMDDSPTSMPAREALDTATLNGARALGLDAGALEPGKLADIVLLDRASTAFVPGYDLVSDVVYSARGDCVDTVIIDGKLVMRGRKVDWADECIRNVRRISEKFRS